MAQSINVTLADLEKSKVFIPKSDIFRFQQPMVYLEPFMELATKTGGTIQLQAEIGSENGNGDEMDKNIAYSRVSAKLRLPSTMNYTVDDPFFNELFSEVGMVFGLDTQKPEIKVWKGSRVAVCTNQCVFGADSINSVLLKNNISDVYVKAKHYMDNIEKDIILYKEKIERLTNKIYRDGLLDQKIGQILKASNKDKRLGVTSTLGMLNLIQDKTSRYAINDMGEISGWLLYNAMTEVLKKASVMDEATKVLLLEEIFLN